MAHDRDDDALSWAGDEVDPALAKSAPPVRPTVPAARLAGSERSARAVEEARLARREADRLAAERGAVAEDELPEELREDPESDGASGSDEESDGTDSAAAAQAASSALLVTIGVAAGIYLLYTIGWGITLSRQSALVASIVPSDPVGQFMYLLGLWLATAAAPLWFLGTLLLTRHSAARTRILWLVVGVVLLAPLPFIRGN